MRTVVALVETRPETITEDYRRVLDLAGLDSIVLAEPPQVLLASDSAGFRPGWGATPWQLNAVLAWLGEQARDSSVVAVDQRGARPVPGDTWWRDSMVQYLAKEAGPEFLRKHRHVSQLLHPALDAILPDGVQVPVGLASGPSLLLASPALRRGWGLAGAVDMLQRLVTCGAAPRRRAPIAEVAAEALGVAREVMPDLGVVIDGTLWGVPEGAGGRNCVARNILLAGSDPLAVDVVAMRLAGIDPLRVPWVRICMDRGFGQAHPSSVRVVGQADLLNLDFDLQGGTFAADRGRGLTSPLGSLGRLIGRRGGDKAGSGLTETAWGRLYEEYVSGQGTKASGI